MLLFGHLSKEFTVSTKDRLKAHKSLALETHDNSLLKLTSTVLFKIRSLELSKGGHYNASEEEVQGIIANEVKSCRNSAALYREEANSAQDEESRKKFETLYYDKLSEAGLLAMYLPQGAPVASQQAGSPIPVLAGI